MQIVLNWRIFCIKISWIYFEFYIFGILCKILAIWMGIAMLHRFGPFFTQISSSSHLLGIGCGVSGVYIIFQILIWGTHLDLIFLLHIKYNLPFLSQLKATITRGTTSTSWKSWINMSAMLMKKLPWLWQTIETTQTSANNVTFHLVMQVL